MGREKISPKTSHQPHLSLSCLLEELNESPNTLQQVHGNCQLSPLPSGLGWLILCNADQQLRPRPGGSLGLHHEFTCSGGMNCSAPGAMQGWIDLIYIQAGRKGKEQGRTLGLLSYKIFSQKIHLTMIFIDISLARTTLHGLPFG